MKTTFSLFVLASFALPSAFAQTSIQASAANVPAPIKREITDAERGDIFMARKSYRDAIDAYKSIKPQTAILLNKIGIAYHQLSIFDRAEFYYKQALKKDSKYLEARNNLGTVYFSQRNFRRAVKEYEKVIKDRPDSASTWISLAMAYMERKKYDKATDAVGKALALDPNILQSRGAGGTFVQARSTSDPAKHYYSLAKAYAKHGLNAQAIQYIRRSLEEGFKDKQKFAEEPEFAGLRDDPVFQQLMATEQRVL